MADLLIQIRHNLVVPKSPSFVGAVVSRNWHTILRSEKEQFLLRKRAKLGVAVTSMVVCAAVAATLWPHAREAWAVLAAQDDPAELSSLQVNSALRNNPDLIRDNIEAALAAGDADLAGSFAELARDRNVALGEDLSKRVGDAAAEDNSSGQLAKRFASGLVTGDADDIASLSGTMAGDLFVWGDIRDVVR